MSEIVRPGGDNSPNRDNQRNKRQMPDASPLNHDDGERTREIVHKRIGESHIPVREETSARTSAVQKIVDDSLVSVRACLSSPHAIAGLAREGFDSLAEIIVRNNDVAGASHLRTLDHNLPNGFYTDPITVTRLFPGMLFGDTTAAEHMNTLLQAEKESALADTERSIPQTAGLRKLVTHYATHQLSPEEVINAFGVDPDHRTSLRLEYYHQAREVHGKENSLTDLCREELTRSFLRDQEMSPQYAHEKALEIFCMQQDDDGRRAVFDKFTQLESIVSHSRGSFTRFRFISGELLHHPDLLTDADAQWIIETANNYVHAAEMDPFMEGDVMMAKYILPLEILLEKHKGVPVEELIDRQRNGTDAEVQGSSVDWFDNVAYGDEARFFQEMATISAQQGKFIDAGKLIAAIQPVVWRTGNRDVLLPHTHERQAALQECLREARSLSDTDLLRLGEDTSYPELASLIQMKEALLQENSDEAIAITRQFIGSLTEEDSLGSSASFNKVHALDYCIKEFIAQDPESGGILAAEMAAKLLATNAHEEKVAKFAELSAQQGNVAGLEILYRNASRFKQSTIDQQFGAYAKVALLATKALQTDLHERET